MIKLRNKGLVIGGMLCCMIMLTGCSVNETLSLLMGNQGKQESEETDVNLNALIVDESIQKPEITKNLGEPVTYYVSDTAAALTVECQVSDGGTLTYQWYRNNVDSNGGGTVLEGATSNSYVPSTSETGVTYYYVVITNNKDNHIQLVTSTTQCVTVQGQVLEATETGSEGTAQ